MNRNSIEVYLDKKRYTSQRRKYMNKDNVVWDMAISENKMYRYNL